MSGIGHNQGPTMERGFGWRKTAWKKARAELLPKLPLEIVRIRVKRAKELGLDYKSYAGFRAATGRDVVAFLFSTSALQAVGSKAEIEPARKAKLIEIKGCSRIALAPKSRVQRLRETSIGVLDQVGIAPDLIDSWTEVRLKIEAETNEMKIPSDGVMVIGDTALEREWFQAARLGGYLPADRYFGASK